MCTCDLMDKTATDANKLEPQGKPWLLGFDDDDEVFEDDDDDFEDDDDEFEDDDDEFFDDDEDEDLLDDEDLDDA